MTNFLCITVRFLQLYSHGRGDGGESEWPPSPLRLFQALVASSAGHWNERGKLVESDSALKWLEAQSKEMPPEIVAADAVCGDRPYRLYVPDNVADKVASSWSRGRDADISDYRTEKDVHPMYLLGDTVHYLYPLSNDHCPYLSILTTAARSCTHLGWGIDMVAGNASIISGKQAATLDGHRWQPTDVGGKPLRVPTEGTLDDLMQKHKAFLSRLSNDGFSPVPPLKVFRVHRYRRDNEPIQRPYRVFELRNTDGTRFRYSHRKLVHLAAMVRHLAIETMRSKGNLPPDVPENWVETYIAGHSQCKKCGISTKNKFITVAGSNRQHDEMAAENAHRQLSYLPLPSIGHRHTDPGVRRIMIVAPIGDELLLEHIERHLAGQILKPLRGDEFTNRAAPLLIPVRKDNIAYFYTKSANAWASFTPVILPGHDDHKPEKTRKLLQKALQQSGVEHPCEFEWNTISHFPQSYTAQEFIQDGDKKRHICYIRPSYLLGKPAVHMKLRFSEGVKVPGPLAIGAGRHCGLGLFAAEM